MNIRSNKMSNRVTKTYVLVGSTGAVGSCLTSHLPDSTIAISGQRVRHWISQSNSRNFKMALETDLPNLSKSSLVLINCVGITNPLGNIDELVKVNYEFPLRLLQSLDEKIATFVNFGSVLESFVQDDTNAYLNTKVRISTALRMFDTKTRLINFKLNTIYGGYKNPAHLLIGQLENSIKMRTTLPLSSGSQIREYHHLRDVSIVLSDIIQQGSVFGEIDLNYGFATTIRDVIYQVMRNLNLDHLLDFDFREDPVNDNYNYWPSKSEYLKGYTFRDPVAGITSYLQSRIAQH